MDTLWQWTSSLASLPGCASVRKPGTIFQRLDRLYDDVESVVDRVEQAVEDATTADLSVSAWCELSSREHEAVAAWFWQLLEQQQSSNPILGPESAGRILEQALPQGQVVFEDELLFELFAKVFPDFPTSTELALQWLHRVAAGHWLHGTRERGYTLSEWLLLFKELQMPRLVIEATTVPLEDPLCVSALLALPASESAEPLLLCACDNDSYLDRLEHTLDAAGAAASAATINPGAKAETIGVRPLGAILVYSWLLPVDEPAARPDAAATGKLPASRASAALGTHPARRVEGGGGRQGAAQRGLIAHAPLQSGATTLGYCSKGRLLLVGCRSGSVQVAPGSLAPSPRPFSPLPPLPAPHRTAPPPPSPPPALRLPASAPAAVVLTTRHTRACAAQVYSPSADWSSLKLHFAIEAHASPVACLNVWMHSLPPPPATRAAPAHDAEELEEAVVLQLPLLLTSGSDPDALDAEHTSRNGCPHVFGYDLERLIALPVLAPIEQPVSCMLGLSHGSAAQHRLLVGCTNGDILVLSPAHAAEPRPAAGGGPAASSTLATFSGVGGAAASDGGRAAAAATAAAGRQPAVRQLAVEAVVLVLQHRLRGAHDGPVSALHMYTPRSLLCTGGADSVVCVWRLPLEAAAAAAAAAASDSGTRAEPGGRGGKERRGAELLGRLDGRTSVAGGPSGGEPSAATPPPPLGPITHISAVAVGGGGAPRVLAAAASGAAIEWDLHGGGACRRLHMPAGLQAIARDARVQGEPSSSASPRPGSIWFGQADGSLQLWRWRRPLPHLHGSARLAEAAGSATAHSPASSSGRDVEPHPLAMASYVPAPAAKSPGGKAKVKVEEFEREEV